MTELEKLSIDARALMCACGGMRGEYEAYPVSHWQKAVAHDRTRLGYWDWVAARVEAER